MSLILIIVVLCILFGGLPTWGYHHYGYAPSGLAALVLVFLVLWLLIGRE